MGFLRPVRMAKIGLLGLKEDRETILTVLHDLRVAQVEPVSADVLRQLAPDHGTERQRRISEEALRFRGLATALPRIAGAPARHFGSLEEVLALAKTVPIDAEVGALRREDDQLQSRAQALDQTLRLLQRLDFYGDRLELLRGESFVSYVPEGPAKAVDLWRQGLAGRPETVVLDGGGGLPRRLVVTVPQAQAEAVVRAAGVAGVRLEVVPELKGTVAEARAAAEAEQRAAARRRAEVAERLGALARDWYATVAAIDEALQVEARLLEVLPKMASSQAAFAVEAWVPERDVERLRRIVDNIVGGRTYLYRVPTDEEPPTLLDNPPGVRWYEFFIRFYSLPKATEWDPTWVFALVFPVFFGFMIGDWGYGLAILLVSFWMLAGFPGARRLPGFGREFMRTIMGPSTLQQLARTLVPGAIIAIIFGVYFDSFFGIDLLHQLIGYHAPIRPDTDLSHLLLIAGFVGLAMVSLGFLLGALKEYFHHHYRGAVGKAGGIGFAWGVTLFGLGVLRHASGPATHSPYLWLAIVAGGVMVGGEGLQNGMLGLIEVVSHILSYTRLVGILLASVILAALINSVAVGEFHSGGLAILIGAVVLVVGQSFNVILCVFEPAIQGMRLMFVEYFSKFYEGDGHEFRPFGADRRHTLPLVQPDGRPGAAAADATAAR